MSFGFSLGDFIAVLQLAKDVRQRLIDAPEQFRAISEDVKTLSNVARDVDDILPDLTSQQEKSLHEIAQGCCSVLEQLKETLEKYQEIDSGAKGISGRSRRVWKRLQWDQKEIDQFRSRITLNITAFSTFLGRIANNVSFATKAGVDRLHERQDSHDYQIILDWLTPIDYAPQQHDFISRRQAGTGQWLLDSAEFQAWLETDKQTLFCPGIPGAGKTIISAIVVDYLCTKFQKTPDVSIPHIYCNFKRNHEQKLADLLLSLLKQLAQGQSSMPDPVKLLYDQHKDKRTRPSLNEILRALYAVTALYSRVFIIIDALDECQVDDRCRTTFLLELFNLQAKCGTNVFATSRFIPDITEKFEESSSLKIRASNQDVRRYLEGHMSRLPKCVLRSPDLQEKIKANIIKAVDGMFLLAQLHLDSLIDKTTPRAITRALEKLPKGSDALDQAYQEAVRRIQGQEAGFEELAWHVLSWITCAKRPLTSIELQHALAIEASDTEIGKDNLQDIEEAVSLCAGLVTLDNESNIIRLVHYTTQEYFERTWTSWFPNAEIDITKTCVTYLLFNTFDTGFCPTDEEFEARLQLNPLYNYASQNWGHHARAALADAEQLILDLLGSEANVSGCSQAMMASKNYRYRGYSQKVPRQIMGVHLAAYFGLKEAITALLKNGHDLDSKDTYGKTPLSWAALNGQEAVVKQLLQKGAELESKDKYGQTPLSHAARNGHEAVVKLLLEKGAKLESKDKKYGQTPLLWATSEGHEAVVKLLLNKGAKLESKDKKNGRTPLPLAAGKGHETVVKLLLKNGAELESKSHNGRTPLSWAAEKGHEAVVKLLLEKSVELESKSKNSRTPLSWAAQNGHEAVVKLLLEKSAELESKDYYGQTPLSCAASEGHEAVVKLLLENGTELDSKSRGDQTPLSWAARKGHEAVVKLLLEKGAELQSRDYYGQTPLSWAARNGHKAVVTLLLEKGTELESKTHSGQTPLSWAAETGREAVVKLLLEKGAELESKDKKYGWTPLSWAARNGHEAVVKLLLEKGAELESKDTTYGRTPLSRAAENGHEAVVKLLLEKGAELETKDKGHGRTPLSYAAGNGHQVVVKLLLEKGARKPQ